MFGCGDAVAPGAIGLHREVSEAALALRGDRVRHWDGLERDVLDWAREQRLRARDWLLQGLGLVGLLPSTTRGTDVGWGGGGSGAPPRPAPAGGRVHTVPSTAQTVRLGVFDPTLPDVLEIEPGDTIVYPDTWSHFLNRLQPGTPAEELARLRRDNPGRGPHSIIGPVGVRGAAPGDLIALHFERLEPVAWGATFVNPGDLGTGTLPDEFPTGQVRYLDLDVANARAQFAPGITVPLGPFQGTFATAPSAPESVSSIPPGQHAGNIDLRDLTVGSTLYIPVWQAGARLFTGDSHATQGDGEVNNQALESAMREVRVRVEVVPRAGWDWPVAETAEYWIPMGVDL